MSQSPSTRRTARSAAAKPLPPWNSSTSERDYSLPRGRNKLQIKPSPKLSPARSDSVLRMTMASDANGSPQRRQAVESSEASPKTTPVKKNDETAVVRSQSRRASVLDEKANLPKEKANVAHQPTKADILSKLHSRPLNDGRQDAFARGRKALQTAKSVNQLRTDDYPMKSTSNQTKAGLETQFDENHILEVDPSITVRKPSPRRISVASDPVGATVPTHEESVKYQAKQFVAHTLSIRPQLDHGENCQELLPISPLVKSQQEHNMPIDESAYQAALRKAYAKPALKAATQQLRLGDGEMPYLQAERLESGIDKRAEAIEQFRKQAMQLRAMDFDPSRSGANAAQENHRQDDSLRLGGSMRGHDSPAAAQEKPRKEEQAPKLSDYRLVDSLGSLAKTMRDLGPDSSVDAHENCPKGEEAVKAFGRRPDSLKLEKSQSLAKIKYDLGLDGPADARENSPVAIASTGKSPQKNCIPNSESKSVRWDPAITLTDSDKGENTDAARDLKKLFDNGNESESKQGSENEKENETGIDSFVQTFKQLKKGDKKKLDAFLKALREVQADDENETEEPGSMQQEHDMRQRAQDPAHKQQKTETDIAHQQQQEQDRRAKSARLNPRVREFQPLSQESSPLKPLHSTLGPQHPVEQGIKQRESVQQRASHSIFDDPAVAEVRNCSPTKPSIQIPGANAQAAKKRIIWDNADDEGRVAIMLSQRYAAECLEAFVKKYPLTGQKAETLPKRMLDERFIAKEIGEAAKRRMASEAADIQQKLELLLLKKKETKTVAERG